MANEWVSATAIFNHLAGDSLVDYFAIHGVPATLSSVSQRSNLAEAARGSQQASPTISPRLAPLEAPGDEVLQTFLLEQGRRFEGQVIELLGVCWPIAKVADAYSVEGVDKTIQMLTDKVPILHNAPLRSVEHQVYGMADLIVRLDILEQLFPGTLDRENCPNLKDPENYYRVIDIKFSSLPLASDGIHLLNSGHYPSYKGQLWVYALCLREMLGQPQSTAYVLGRRWSYQQRRMTFRGENFDERLGQIDFLGYDQSYCDKTTQAINWVRRVRSEGHTWTLIPPSIPELYPNMGHSSLRFMAAKEALAAKIGELTMLWYVGLAGRRKAHEDGIFNWRDPKFTAETAGLSGPRAICLNRILEANRSADWCCLPAQLLNTADRITKQANMVDLYVDFETIPDMFRLPADSETELAELFMIGLGWNDQAGWQYWCGTVDNLSLSAERALIEQFIDKLANFPNSQVWHWSGAEPRFWATAMTRQAMTSPPINWQDMCQIFQQEPIGVTGSLDFSLKNVARAILRDSQLWKIGGTAPSNGMDAAIQAYHALHQQSTANFQITGNRAELMDGIRRYNQVDCRAMEKILHYLRLNHTTTIPAISVTDIPVPAIVSRKRSLDRTVPDQRVVRSCTPIERLNQIHTEIANLVEEAQHIVLEMNSDVQ